MAELDGSTYSRDTYEVVAGKHHHRTEKGERVTLTKGDRFRPTRKQAQQGDLEGKARLVERGDAPIGTTVSADIGLRSLEWGSQAALKKALDAGLTVEEMEVAGPSGATGFVSVDVERAVEARD